MKNIKRRLLSLALLARTACTINSPDFHPPTPAKSSAHDVEPVEQRVDEAIYAEDHEANIYKFDEKVDVENAEPDVYKPVEQISLTKVASRAYMLTEEHTQESISLAYGPEAMAQGTHEAWERLFTHELVTALMDKAERFACSVEMATYLAVMSAGGVSRLLADEQMWDAATRFAAHAVHAALIQHCEDDLERALKLYALWAEFGQAQGPVWAKDLFINTDVLEQEIRPARERLLLDRSVNKRDRHERRALNFCLLDRVRLVIAYHVLAHPLPVALDQVVSMQPVQLDWLRQSGRSDIALAYFIARQAQVVPQETPEPQMVAVAEPEEVVAPDASIPVDDETIEQDGATDGDQTYAEDKGYEEDGGYEYEDDEGYWDDEVYEEDGEDTTRPRLTTSVLALPDLTLLRLYQPGEHIWGIVTNIIEAGIFISIEPGVTGFVPKSRLWERIDDLRKLIAVNEQVEVIVVRVNEERHNLDLSMQLPEYDPLLSYKKGDEVSGRVIQVNDFGVKIEIEPHVYGGVHISKMWEPIDNAGDVLNFGDTVRAYILSIDEQKRRLELSMQLPENDPLHAYRPGDVVSGKVRELRDFGAFVIVKPGVVGLIHRNDMGRGVYDVRRALKLGDEVKALVIRVEWEKRRLSLSTSEM